MATQKPRLTVTLEPHTYAVLAQLAELQNRPKSKVITELLESVTPVLERTCYVLQMAERATSGVNDDIRASMERSEAKLQAMMNEAMGQLDIFAGALVGPSREDADEATGGEPKARRGVAESEALPPHSNTGVTIGDKSKKPRKNNH